MMKKIYTPLFILLFFVLSSGIVKSQSYCSANGNCSYTGAILDFSTSGGLNNISNYFSGCTSGGYKYFSKKKVSVFAGSEFVFRVAAGGYGYKGYAIWVDWNEDGDFNDTGEEVYKSTSTTGNAVTDTIKVPSSAKSGLKRMRVISKNYSIPSSSCGYVGYGEVEDYNVNVVANKGLDLGIMEIESPEIFAVGKNEVTLKLRNGASDSIVSFSVGYKLDNNNAVLDSNVKPVSRVDAGDIVSYKLSNKINVATSGQHSLKIWIYKPNKTQPDDKTGNDTISLTFKTGLSGKYTLGSGGDYTSFSAAISDLNSLGVAGPVTFSILSGNYNTSFALNDFKGMSDVNTVTFDGSSRSSVKISSTGASSSHALITIDKGDYFIIKNMTLQNTYTSGGIGVHLKNGADHNTLYNLDISLASTSNTSHGILASNTTSLSGGGLTANNTTVRKCQIKGGYSGIAFLGRSYTFYNYDNQVIDNIIFNQQRHGIYLESQNDFDIFDNRIEGMKDTLGACVYLFGYNYGVEIDANILKPYKTGVYSYFTNYNNLYDSLTITNNIIADFGNSTSQLGIYLNRTTNSKIYNNTIVTDGTLGTKSEAAIHGVYSNYISIYNNILASMDQTLLLSFQPLYFNSGFPDLDYNLYYYPKKSSKLFYNTKYFDNYTSWQKSYDKIEVPHDKNSIDNKNPNFKSTTDFHISSSYAPYVGKLIYLKEDVDGDKRCKYRNSIGADESQFKTAEPKAGFTVDDTVCYNSPITFLNKADEGDPIAHFWYLNGVFQTNDLHFTKVFQSGTYVDTVTLISINCGG